MVFSELAVTCWDGILGSDHLGFIIQLRRVGSVGQGRVIHVVQPVALILV